MRRQGLIGHLRLIFTLLLAVVIRVRTGIASRYDMLVCGSCNANKAIKSALLFSVIIPAFLFGSTSARSGDFSFEWGTTHNWPANSTGPLTFTLGDEYGYQLDVRLSISRIGGTALSGYPDDLLSTGGNQFGLETSIWLVWDANNGSGSIGESTNTATMEVLSGGVPFSSGALEFNVADIDPVDNNGATDRCDFITATGNAGNPSLSYVGGTAATRSVRIGPATGSGATGAIAANQAQCVYNIGTTGSNSSNGDDNGTILVTYPAGTHTATIAYDESIENVYGVTSRDASARGVGVWGATIFSVSSQALTLEKTTNSTGYTGAGEVLNYTYTITNDGPLPINTGQNIQIQDDKIGTFTCGTITANIPVGGTHSCTNTYTTVAADATAPNVTNNAIAGVGTGSQSFATRLQSNSDSAIVPRRPTLTLTKISNGGTGGFTFTGNNGWTSQTITTTAAGGAGTAGTTQTLAASTTTVITESMPSGWIMTGVTCTGTGNGTQPGVNTTTGTITFTLSQTAAGSNIACTVTNALRPTVKVQKVTQGGVGGPFTFARTNLQAIANITTTAVNTPTPASPTARNVTTIGTAVTITETAASGYVLTAASCTDANSAITGNTGSIGSLAGNVLTIPAGNIVAGADFTCIFTNSRLPTITLTKITNDGTGSFTFTGDNGWSSQTITTTAAGGAGTSGATQTLTAVANATTITETIPAGWAMTGVTCSGAGGGTQPTINLTAGTISFTPAQTAAGSDIACTVSNLRLIASLAIVKSYSLTKGVGNTEPEAQVGDTIVYTYVVTNDGNQTISNVEVDDSGHTGQGTWVDPAHNGTITADNGPAGDSPDSNGDATIWGTLGPLDVITFTSNYVVTQADIDGQM